MNRKGDTVISGSYHMVRNSLFRNIGLIEIQRMFALEKCTKLRVYIKTTDLPSAQAAGSNESFIRS